MSTETIDQAMRADGWENTLLGLGGTKDPTAYTRFGARARIDDVTLEALYAEDHFAARIVEALPKSALRPGWELVVPGDPVAGARIRDAFKAYEDRLCATQELSQGACWGRLFGGALTWIVVDDGRDPALPLDEANVRTVLGLHTFDRRDVRIERLYADPTHPRYRRPETYRIRQRLLSAAAAMSGLQGQGGHGALIHETRLIRWDGQPSTDDRRLQNQGWDDSVLERCWDALRQCAEDYGSKSLLLGRVAQAVYKLKNLYKMIAGKEEETLRRRMSLLDASRSRARAILLDVEEAFENVTQPLGGVPEMIDRGALRLAAAAEMPLSVLMGQSVLGAGTNAEADQETWNTTVDGWRTLELRPRHERLVRAILLAQDGPTGGREPEQYSVNYRALRLPTRKQLAEVEKLEADRDALYIDKGVAPPEVIALARFTTVGAGQVQLDEAGVRAAYARRLELAAQPPKDNAQLGTIGPRSSEVREVIKDVTNGAISRESGIAILVDVHGFAREAAERILGPMGWRSQATPAPQPPGPAPAPQPGQAAGAPQPPPGTDRGGAPPTGREREGA
jgi:phage-related protein (TIGR01555 family)